VSAVHRAGVRSGSTDGTAYVIHAEFPWCRQVRLAANVGPAGGNNAGIKYALDRGAEWVLLLNNDTVVSPDLTVRLADAALAHAAEFGVIGPIILHMDEPDVVMTDGCIFNHPDYHGFFQRKPVPVARMNPPAITEVDVVNGCCMMVAAEVFRRIGLFDERFFLYHEETDFCLRARKAGFRCGVIGDPLVWHKGSSAVKQTGKRLGRYCDARNLLLVLWKHSGARFHGRGLASSAVTYLRHIYYWYSLEREDGHPESADAVIEGFCDALRGRYGRMTPGRHLALPVIRWVFERWRTRPRLQPGTAA